jgi:hypothetical protein
LLITFQGSHTFAAGLTKYLPDKIQGHDLVEEPFGFAELYRDGLLADAGKVE